LNDDNFFPDKLALVVPHNFSDFIIQHKINGNRSVDILKSQVIIKNYDLGSNYVIPYNDSYKYTLLN
jgi:hypothetical protein